MALVSGSNQAGLLPERVLSVADSKRVPYDANISAASAAVRSLAKKALVVGMLILAAGLLANSHADAKRWKRSGCKSREIDGGSFLGRKGCPGNNLL